MYAYRNILVFTSNHSCRGNATMSYTFIFRKLFIVNNIKTLRVSMGMQQCFSLHCFRGAKYFVVLSKM